MAAHTKVVRAALVVLVVVVVVQVRVLPALVVLTAVLVEHLQQAVTAARIRAAAAVVDILEVVEMAVQA